MDRQRHTYGLRQKILRWTEPDKRDEKKHQQKQEKERKDKTKISTTLDPHSITFPWLEPLWLQAPDERLILYKCTYFSKGIRTWWWHTQSKF